MTQNLNYLVEEFPIYVRTEFMVLGLLTLSSFFKAKVTKVFVNHK